MRDYRYSTEMYLDGSERNQVQLAWRNLQGERLGVIGQTPVYFCMWPSRPMAAVSRSHGLCGESDFRNAAL